MSRFLFVAFSDSGHLNPLVAVVQHLERAGHEVVLWSAQRDLKARLAQADVRARCLGGAPGPEPAPLDEVTFARKMANPKWARLWLAQTLVESVPAQVEPLRKVMRELSPDVVACDAMAYAGALAAELEGLPWAGLSTGFFAVIPPDWHTPVTDVFERLAPARDALFASFAVAAKFRVSDVVSPWLNVVFTSFGFVARARSQNHYAHHVGPAAAIGRRGDEPGFPWERLRGDRPLVYVAFGSHLSHPPEVYERLFAALEPDEAFFVVASKSLMRDRFAGSLPAHVLAVEYAPQLALLERAAVMVNHGGANSVSECLGRGCPMLVLPLVYDQPAVGRLVAESGAGATLDADALTVEVARAALVQLLDPGGSARVRARALQATLGDGGERTADLLANLARTRAPISP